MHPKLRTLLTWTISLAFFMDIMDATALNTSLPKIANTFNVSPLIMRTAIISYLISVGLFLPISSYFADKLGTKKIFIFANFVFALGSICCGLATNIVMLTAFRILQGIGGAFLAPISRLIMVKMYPKNEIMKGQAFAAMISSLAFFSGPLVGGVITHYLNWRIIFFINIPVAILAIIIGKLKMPTYFSATPKSFDIMGYFYIAITLIAALFFCDNISNATISLTYKIFAILTAMITTYLYIVHSRKTTNPLISNKLWQQKQIIQLFSASFILRLAFNSLPFLIPLMLQSGYNYSAVETGIAMSFTAMGFFAAKIILLRINSLFSIKQIMIFNQIISAFCFLAITVITYHLNWIFLYTVLFTYGLFQSMAVSTINVFIYQKAPADLTSQVTMVNSLVIQLSASFAIALAAAYLLIIAGNKMLAELRIPLFSFHYIFIFEVLFILISLIIILQIDYRETIQPSGQ
jgi:MFS family permease